MFLQPLKEKRFFFECGPHMSCFTVCCAELDLKLTPYDVLRIKKRIGISSSEFIEKYTEIVPDSNSRFPVLKLKMKDDKNKSCPFVSAAGCSIYEDRPSACRMYPIARATTKPDPKGNVKEQYFIVKEKHCLGFRSKKEWSIKEWIKDQGLEEYNKFNDLWMEILTAPYPLGDKNSIQKKIKMFLMASYNLDRFRLFLFETRFFDIFDIPDERKEKIRENDKELLLFAMDWLWFSLYRRKTIKLKNDM